MEGDSFLYVCIQLVQVALVELRDQNGLDQVAPCGKHLLLQAADGHDLAQKRELARHCHVLSHDLAGNQGVDGSSHGNSCGRTVLGSCSLGNMQVDAVAVKPRHVYAVRSADALDITESDVGAFLHHVTQLSGNLQFAAARDVLCLDGKNISAHACPSKTYGHADLVGADDLVLMEDGLAQITQQQTVIDLDRSLEELSGILQICKRRSISSCLQKSGSLVAVLNYLHGHLAVDLVQSLLEVTHSGFTGILLCNLAKHLVRVLDIRSLQTMFCAALGHQVLLSDVEFLVRRVARKLNDLHPVQKRAGDGVGRVCSHYEQHVGHIERNVQVVVSEG